MTSIVFFFIGLITFSLVDGTSHGFTLNLIHRDSPLSPFYNPNHTHFDRLRNMFSRSISRAKRLNPIGVSTTKTQSNIVVSNGEYLMKLSIGTPPVEVLGIADTGSDLVWVQCQPCDLCYVQRSPIFDPRQSSSFLKMLCGTRFCNALEDNMRQCSQDRRTCGYMYSYGDQSYTDGDLAFEKFTLSSEPPVYFRQVAFGCGVRNGGTFDEAGSGIIGLGGGTLSLISQMGSKINGKFSYCLVHQSEESNNITSKINFGTDGVVSGPDMVSTPLVAQEPDTYYYLTLEAISIGNKRVAYRDSLTGNIEKGNIVIDSGTTLTMLRSDVFSELESAINEAVNAERVSDPTGTFDVCFRDASDINIPVITFHFGNNADVKLESGNTFIKVEDGVVCLNIIASDGLGIFGNLSQMDYLVGYDLVEKTVSFMPTDCSKQ